MFNMTTHWWWQNQSDASSVLGKTTNHERGMPPAVIPHTVIVDIVYWQYNWNIWPQNSIPWLRIFFTWPVYFICIATAVRRNCGLTTCSWKVKISFLNAYFVTHIVHFLIHCKQKSLCFLSYYFFKDPWNENIKSFIL